MLKRFRIPARIFIATRYVGRRSIINWDEVRKISENGIEIGAHTVNHKIHSSIGAKEAIKEIMNSKEIREKVTERKINHFAYPKGKIADYGVRYVRLVK